jgi:hypothetical protein
MVLTPVSSVGWSSVNPTYVRQLLARSTSATAASSRAAAEQEPPIKVGLSVDLGRSYVQPVNVQTYSFDAGQDAVGLAVDDGVPPPDVSSTIGPSIM